MSRLTALIREDREYKNFASAFTEAMSAAKPLPIAVNGLTGGAESAKKRDELAERLGLPPNMTPNAFLAALRVLCNYDEYCALVGREEQ